MSNLKEEIFAACLEKSPLEATGTVSASFRFPAAFTAFSGHFPGYPILPAFVQILIAIVLVEEIDGCALELESVEKAKFLAEIRPDQTITVECTPAETADRRKWKVKIMLDGRIAASFMITLDQKNRHHD